MIRFEWDPMKALTNQRKHGVTFEDAMHVFQDPFALFEQDRKERQGISAGRRSAWLEGWCRCS
jgi:uncharacterized DUF497 family protein